MRLLTTIISAFCALSIMHFSPVGPIEEPQTRSFSQKRALEPEDENALERGQMDGLTNEAIIARGISAFQEHYDAEEDEDTKAKLQALINTASALLGNNGGEERDSTNTRYANNPLFLAIAAYMTSADWLLAQELFLHSIDENTVEDEEYIPVYGSRISGSPLIEGFAYGTALTGGGEFESGENLSILQNDLKYAIELFSCHKSSSTSRTVILTDRYDFTEEGSPDYGDFVDQGIQGCIAAHAEGTLKYYYVTITVDMTEVLKPTVVSSNSSSLVLNLQNRSGSQKTVVYNSKLVSETNALYWQNLSNLQYVKIPSGSSANLTIERTSECYCVFSYITGLYVHVSTVVRAYGTSNCYLDYHLHRAVQGYGGHNILNLGKSGNSWMMMLRNTSNQRYRVEYNSRMCTGSDAQNWTNLVDVVSDYAEAHDDFVFLVSEYGFSTHIALRRFTSTTEYRYWINDLSLSTNATIASAQYDYYPYLLISVVGKTNTVWTIRVASQISEPLYFSYNSKMCFKNDGLNWSNLNNVVNNNYLQGYGSTTVQISENWFANSVAISFFNSNNVRLITCGYNLSAANNTLSVENNHI